MFFVRDQRELTALNTALSFKGKNEDGRVLQVSMDFISDEEGVKDNFIDMSIKIEEVESSSSNILWETSYSGSISEIKNRIVDCFTRIITLKLDKDGMMYGKYLLDLIQTESFLYAAYIEREEFTYSISVIKVNHIKEDITIGDIVEDWKKLTDIFCVGTIQITRPTLDYITNSLLYDVIPELVRYNSIVQTIILNQQQGGDEEDD